MACKGCKHLCGRSWCDAETTSDHATGTGPTASCCGRKACRHWTGNPAATAAGRRRRPPNTLVDFFSTPLSTVAKALVLPLRAASTALSLPPPALVPVLALALALLPEPLRPENVLRTEAAAAEQGHRPAARGARGARGRVQPQPESDDPEDRGAWQGARHVWRARQAAPHLHGRRVGGKVEARALICSEIGFFS